MYLRYPAKLVPVSIVYLKLSTVAVSVICMQLENVPGLLDLRIGCDLNNAGLSIILDVLQYMPWVHLFLTV